jgi:Arc/MetJ family transcription regulator
MLTVILPYARRPGSSPGSRWMNRAGEYASMHHDATMLELGVRTTIDLPDDLHKQALAIARDTHRTLSETVADLMRRGLGAGRTAALSEDPRTGLPLVSVGTVVTSEDVRSLEDEE